MSDSLLTVLSNLELPPLLVFIQDVHARYRTEAHQDVVGRFNERWVPLRCSLDLEHLFGGYNSIINLLTCFLDSFCHSHPAKTVLSLMTSSTSCPSPVTWQTSSLSLQRLRWLQCTGCFFVWGWLYKCCMNKSLFDDEMISGLWPVVSFPSGGWCVSTRAGAEGPEGVPSGHSACGCVGGLLQDHGPGQDLCPQSCFTTVFLTNNMSIAWFLQRFLLFSRPKECWSSSRRSQRRPWGAPWLWLRPEVEASQQHWGWLWLEPWLSGTVSYSSSNISKCYHLHRVKYFAKRIPDPFLTATPTSLWPRRALTTSTPCLSSSLKALMLCSIRLAACEPFNKHNNEHFYFKSTN